MGSSSRLEKRCGVGGDRFGFGIRSARGAQRTRNLALITVPVFKTRPGSLGLCLRMIVARRALTHPLAVRYESVLAGKQ